MNWLLFLAFSFGCILSFLAGVHFGANAALREIKRRIQKGGAQ